MDKHPNNFTLEDFEAANHEDRKEVIRFWRDYGQPSQMPFFAERIITALKHRDSNVLFGMPEGMKDYFKKERFNPQHND